LAIDLAVGVPGTWLAGLALMVPGRNWESPVTTARTSRVGGMNPPPGGGVQAFALASVAVHGGRNRHRPRTAPVGGPASGRTVPHSRSLVIPVAGLMSTPYTRIRRDSSVVMPSNLVRTAASPAPKTVRPPVPINETLTDTYAGSTPGWV